MGIGNATWIGIFGQRGDRDINKNGRCLLQFCASNELCIINTFFSAKKNCKYTWYRNSLGQRSLIDFCVVLADLHQGNQCGNTYLQRENAQITGTFLATVSMIKFMLNAFKKKCGEIVGSI